MNVNSIPKSKIMSFDEFREFNNKQIDTKKSVERVNNMFEIGSMDDDDLDHLD